MTVSNYTIKKCCEIMDEILLSLEEYHRETDNEDLSNDVLKNMEALVEIKNYLTELREQFTQSA
tara:strand:+ start:327 stop:518 length:192 start_codon:yes stop_codon:yes gene_type:complete